MRTIKKMDEKDQKTFLVWHTEFVTLRNEFEKMCKTDLDPNEAETIIETSRRLLREFSEVREYSRGIHKKHVLCSVCSYAQCEGPMDDTIRYDRLLPEELADIDAKEDGWEDKRSRELSVPLRARGKEALKDYFQQVVKSLYNHDDWACSMLDKYEPCSTCGKEKAMSL